MLGESVALRCKYCGAPLDGDDVKTDSEYVTCQYCGTTQQRIDAKAYLDQLMGQVRSWISNSIPTGFNMAGAENVDPVARHNIFVNNIRPKVELELNEYKFSTTSLLGNSLITLPFSTKGSFKPVHQSSKAFEFNERVKSISALAVDDSSQELINEALTISQSYAMMINNANLLTDSKDGKFHIMSNNFKESINTLKKGKGNELVIQRFEALSKICDGFENLISGNIMTAESDIKSGRNILQSIKDPIFTDVNYGIMYQAVEQEISICDVVLNIIEILNTSGGDALSMLNIIKNVMDMPLASNPKWTYLLNNKERYNEVFKNVAHALSAKAGGTVPVSSGDGDILVPFWEIDLRYSFETGSLWKKRSVEVKEDLLICADFVIDQNCLNNPKFAVTDIFKERPESSFLDSFKGNEKSISAGEGIGSIQDSVGESSAAGRKILLPLSTFSEAEKMCMEYLSQCTSSYKKLKLSKPDVRKLIYVPCKLNGNTIIPSASFGTLAPGRLSVAVPANMIV